MRYRVLVGRDTPHTGAFAWAALDDAGSVLESGTSDLRSPPAAGACELVVASDLVLLARVQVPAAQRRRLSEALRFLVEDMVVCDPQRLHVVEAPGAARDSVCLGIVDREWLQSVLARLARSGLTATRAVPELLLAELAPGAWTVVWKGRDGFVRTGEAEGFTLDSPEDASPPVALRLAVEKAPPQRIVLRTAAGAAAPDARLWSQALGIPVELGAAWNWAEARAGQCLEFLQGDFAPRATDRSWSGRLRRTALLATALLLAASAGIAAEWAARAQERKALIAQMHALYRQAFGEGAVLVDAPLQMQRALAELRRRNGEPAASDFLPLLGAVSVLLDPARQRIETIGYERGRLTILLRPHDPATLAALAEELRARTPIQGLEMRMENVSSKGSTLLRLTASAENQRWASARP